MLPNRNIPYTSQPQTPIAINWNNPITSKLIFASPGGRYASVWPLRLMTRNGVRTNVAVTGVVNGFGTTVGTSVSDALYTGVLPTGNDRTYFIRFNMVSGNANLVQRLLDIDAENLYINGSQLVFIQRFSTTDGQWRGPDPSISASLWYTTAFTYNSSNIANNGQFYLNGRAIATTRTAAPAGTALAATGEYIIGNRVDLLRNWGGYIGEVFIWNRILTEPEIFSIHNNSWQIFQPRASNFNFTKVTYPDPVPTLESPAFNDNKAKFKITF